MQKGSRRPLVIVCRRSQSQGSDDPEQQARDEEPQRPPDHRARGCAGPRESYSDVILRLAKASS